MTRRVFWAVFALMAFRIVGRREYANTDQHDRPVASDPQRPYRQSREHGRLRPHRLAFSGDGARLRGLGGTAKRCQQAGEAKLTDCPHHGPPLAASAQHVLLNRALTPNHCRQILTKFASVVPGRFTNHSYRNHLHGDRKRIQDLDHQRNQRRRASYRFALV